MCWRDFAKFSHLAVVAKFISKKFTAKGIHNIVLFQSSQSVVESVTKKINEVLLNSEQKWNDQQKILQKERVQRKMKEHRKEGEYITKLLQACKSWDGPFYHSK